MLTFNPNKQKNISFSINVEGIDPTLLEYNLRLSNNVLDLGFKGYKAKNGEIVFEIPPLKNITEADIFKSLKTAKLEVNDKNNKYYLKPFEDNVTIKEEVKVVAKVQEEQELTEKDSFSVSASINEINDDVTPIIKTPIPKKSSKFGKFLQD